MCALGAGTNAGAAIIAGSSRTDPPSSCANTKRAAECQRERAQKKRQSADRKKAGGDKGADHKPSRSENEQLGRDPFRAMGGNSPMCARGSLAAKQRNNCRGSGSLTHRYPIDRYGFDIHIKTGVSSIPGNIWYAVQSIALFVWIGLLYLVKGVLLLLEWAFSLDLVGDSMPQLKKALARLHNRVLGEPWFLAALSFAGLWGIYRGLVQRRTIQTLAGLAATVAMMVAMLVVISRPAETVGRVHQLSSQASLAIVSGATTGTFNRPARGFSEAMSRIFDTLVLRPWCALEFSDVEFCLANPRKVIPRDAVPDDPKIAQAAATSRTVADMWLRFDANGDEDNDQRNQIYEQWKDRDGDRLQAVVRIQKRGPTAARLALLTLIAIGMVGAILTLGWIGLRLLGYSVMSLILTLFAPAFFLVAVLGDSGRLTVLAWAKRLLGALVAGFIYSILLAIVIVGATMLASLDELGWVATWMLQIVFWWSLFLKRNDILAFATAPKADDSSFPSYFAWRTGIGAAAGAFGGTKAAGEKATERQRFERFVHREGRERATSQSSKDRLKERAERAQLAKVAEARSTLDHAEGVDDRLGHIDRQLGTYHRRSELAAARGEKAPVPSGDEEALLARRRELASTKAPKTELDHARHTVDQASRNQAHYNSPLSPADVDHRLDARREEIKLAPEHERNLRAAGISPETYRSAAPERQAELRERSAERLRSDRALLAAIPQKPGEVVKPKQVRLARKEFDRAEIKQGTKAERGKVRDQHRSQRRERKLARSRGQMRPPSQPRR